MRPTVLFPLFASVTSLSGVGDKNAKLIEKMAGNKLVDLLWHLPYNIIDRTYAPALIYAESGRIITLKVKILEHIEPKSKKQPYKVIATDGTAEIELIFFKVYAQTIAKNLPLYGERIISGKIERFNNSIQMTHPDYIVPVPQADQVLGFEPVYPLTAGISNRFANKICHEALARCPQLPEWLDENHKAKMKFPSFNQALYEAHHPQSLAETEPSSLSRTRLAYDELLANQLALAIVRQRVKKQIGNKLQGNGLLRKKALDFLPFKLTDSQEKVLNEIYGDMAGEYRMHRLLQGDVGSGKTIVAFMAMLNAVECGKQAAIMAPTEILAKQHLETLQPLCEEVGVRIELLTGRVKGKARKQILEDLSDGKINILIGTHALFVEDVTFKELGFVVIDEQHRFGVHQRLSLSDKGDKTDILVMTATPIPRTLVLTAYGDMEYSKIDHSPEGRKPTETRVMPITKIDEIVAALKKQLQEGKRAYWVCPLVEESEKVDLAAAQNRFEILQHVFGKEVGLVHGRMKEKEKDEVMQQFKKGEIKLLVATTVIEVGVNIPEATIMIIEHAERFGLAQLHQLRGRIKRGYEASNCILLYAYPLSETSKSRLNIMRETEDGFLIAEEDLKLRGGGEILGTRQSGFSEFRIADMSIHQDLLLTANKDSKMMMELDPNLKTPRGEALRTLLYLFEKDDSIRTYLAG
ncbi:MAG: ATP-dependent DNA helicase RecG [Alphaproteobacteria bacterium]|nr:ATP-dependent DNA helicase RecG [Alphaproteobacteria bacterium]